MDWRVDGRSSSGVSSFVPPAMTPSAPIPTLLLSWARLERVSGRDDVLSSPLLFGERDSAFRFRLLLGGVRSLLRSSDLLQQSHDSQASHHETEQASCADSVLCLQGVSLLGSVHRRSMGFSPCSICLDSFKEGDRISVLPCKHAFHYDCIKPWLGEANACCPVCKQCPYKNKDIVSEC